MQSKIFLLNAFWKLIQPKTYVIFCGCSVLRHPFFVKLLFSLAITGKAVNYDQEVIKTFIVASVFLLGVSLLWLQPAVWHVQSKMFLLNAFWQLIQPKTYVIFCGCSVLRHPFFVELLFSLAITGKAVNYDQEVIKTFTVASVFLLGVSLLWLQPAVWHVQSKMFLLNAFWQLIQPKTYVIFCGCSVLRHPFFVELLFSLAITGKAVNYDQEVIKTFTVASVFLLGVSLLWLQPAVWHVQSKIFLLNAFWQLIQPKTYVIFCGCSVLRHPFFVELLFSLAITGKAVNYDQEVIKTFIVASVFLLGVSLLWLQPAVWHVQSKMFLLNAFWQLIQPKTYVIFCGCSVLRHPFFVELLFSLAITGKAVNYDQEVIKTFTVASVFLLGVSLLWLQPAVWHVQSKMFLLNAFWQLIQPKTYVIFCGCSVLRHPFFVELLFSLAITGKAVNYDQEVIKTFTVASVFLLGVSLLWLQPAVWHVQSKMFLLNAFWQLIQPKTYVIFCGCSVLRHPFFVELLFSLAITGKAVNYDQEVIKTFTVASVFLLGVSLLWLQPAVWHVQSKIFLLNAFCKLIQPKTYVIFCGCSVLRHPFFVELLFSLAITGKAVNYDQEVIKTFTVASVFLLGVSLLWLQPAFWHVQSKMFLLNAFWQLIQPKTYVIFCGCSVLRHPFFVELLFSLAITGKAVNYDQEVIKTFTVASVFLLGVSLLWLQPAVWHVQSKIFLLDAFWQLIQPKTYVIFCGCSVLRHPFFVELLFSLAITGKAVNYDQEVIKTFTVASVFLLGVSLLWLQPAVWHVQSKMFLLNAFWQLIQPKTYVIFCGCSVLRHPFFVELLFSLAITGKAVNYDQEVIKTFTVASVFLLGVSLLWLQPAVWHVQSKICLLNAFWKLIQPKTYVIFCGCSVLRHPFFVELLFSLAITGKAVNYDQEVIKTFTVASVFLLGVSLLWLQPAVWHVQSKIFLLNAFWQLIQPKTYVIFCGCSVLRHPFFVELLFSLAITGKAVNYDQEVIKTFTVASVFLLGVSLLWLQPAVWHVQSKMFLLNAFWKLIQPKTYVIFCGCSVLRHPFFVELLFSLAITGKAVNYDQEVIKTFTVASVFLLGVSLVLIAACCLACAIKDFLVERLLAANPAKNVCDLLRLQRFTTSILCRTFVFPGNNG